jgi:hypothetical protein
MFFMPILQAAAADQRAENHVRELHSAVNLFIDI